MNTRTGRTRKAHSKKVEISFHSDNGFSSNAHPAINVKVYNLPNVNADNDAREHAYTVTVEGFWLSATLIAHQHGYSGVFGEGRSNGWLVPFYQYRNGKIFQPIQWPGQGPDYGYPSYPDVADPKERKRFVNFRADIMELLEDAKREYVQLASEN